MSAPVVAGFEAMSAGSGAFLLADKVAKALPPTTTWALGWGTVATVGTYLIASRMTTASVATAATLGVAAAYLHAYGHQTAYPHRSS